MAVSFSDRQRRVHRRFRRRDLQDERRRLDVGPADVADDEPAQRRLLHAMRRWLGGRLGRHDHLLRPTARTGLFSRNRPSRRRRSYGVSFVGLNGGVGGGANDAKCTIYSRRTAAPRGRPCRREQSVAGPVHRHLASRCDARLCLVRRWNGVKPVMFTIGRRRDLDGSRPP